MKKRKKKKQKSKPTVAKISEMIIQYAGDYIDLGKDLSDKQRYLNVACMAWNTAILKEEERSEAVNEFLKHYEAMNPDVDDADGLRHDLELLIEQKLELFPDVKRMVVSARIQEVDGKLTVTAMSTASGLLKK